MQKAATAWLIEQDLQQTGYTPTPEQQSMLKYGEDATKLVVQYAEWLVTTCNHFHQMNFGVFQIPIPVPSHSKKFRILTVITAISLTQCNITLSVVLHTAYGRKLTVIKHNVVLTIPSLNRIPPN